jgi:hypothetical protein
MRGRQMTMTTMTMRDSDIIEYIEGVEDEIRRLRAKITAVVEGLGDDQRRRVEAWMSARDANPPVVSPEKPGVAGDPSKDLNDVLEKWAKGHKKPVPRGDRQQFPRKPGPWEEYRDECLSRQRHDDGLAVLDIDDGSILKTPCMQGCKRS